LDTACQGAVQRHPKFQQLLVCCDQGAAQRLTFLQGVQDIDIVGAAIEIAQAQLLDGCFRKRDLLLKALDTLSLLLFLLNS
jgi:hypothetical protein